MIWILGGYILTAISFYSYITMAAKEEPEYLALPTSNLIKAHKVAYSAAAPDEHKSRLTV